MGGAVKSRSGKKVAAKRNGVVAFFWLKRGKASKLFLTSYFSKKGPGVLIPPPLQIKPLEAILRAFLVYWGKRSGKHLCSRSRTLSSLYFY